MTPLDLTVRPLYTHHARLRLPPILSYTGVDYCGRLVGVEGRILTPDGRVDVQGIGRLDHNFNLW